MPSKNCQRSLIFRQSGEISPNMVTLLTSICSSNDDAATRSTPTEGQTRPNAIKIFANRRSDLSIRRSKLQFETFERVPADRPVEM